MVAKKIRVLIVDDSMFFREVLSRGLSKDQGLEIVGTANDAEDAKRKITLLKPDVLTLDVEMPKMSGIDFLKQLMQTTPLPVIMVSSINMRVFDTLDAGAVDFVKKPESKKPDDMELFFQDLAAKIKIASVAKVGRARNSAARPVATPSATATSPSIKMPQVSRLGMVKLSGNMLANKRYVVAIGASTGGTEAILNVLQRMPEQMPGIVVTQHMPAGFTKMFAERLNKLCALEVKEACDNDIIQPGRALIAPGGVQMKVVRRVGGGYAVRCVGTEKVSGHCPSVDVLFQSMAEVVKQDAVGVIMTGMGSDGANGLLKMRQSGAYTIGQDKESCVVYGMPMVAFNNGAVCKQTSCDNIATEVLQYLKQKGC